MTTAINVLLTEKDRELVDHLVGLGFASSRADLARLAIREYAYARGFQPGRM